MKRLASQLCLMLAAVAAASAALAGTEVLKCVDNAGRVTLTDQPCEGAARVTRMSFGASSESTSQGGTGNTSATASGPGMEPQAAPLQRYAATPRMQQQHGWRPRLPARDRPLARDVATLKAARAQLLLLDADRQQQPQLATLQ
ncbi:DUF4124 domain-containing protein [Massilia sp.]|uniref:DUF4124 domain-containing protein n=1 Tax=Massilia sp. TaxID=1882437 RepID=UPI0028A91062|nr:DUF4124 domain-containing protein [Massilia sp.]